MADRRGALFPLLILTWIILSPTPQSVNHELGNGVTLKDAIAEEQYSLEVLNNSSYIDTRFDAASGYADLNLTGFEPERGYIWSSLSQIKKHVTKLSDWTQGALRGEIKESRPYPLYENVTGYVHGRWAHSDLEKVMEPPTLNLTEYSREDPFGGPRRERHFGRNFTSGTEGDVSIQFSQKAQAGETLGLNGVANITEVNVELKLSDDTTGNENEMLLRGIYFQSVGQAILTTTSPKFAGIFALPHFTPTDYTFNLSRTVLNESISRTIQRQINRDTLTHNPWSTHHEGVPDDSMGAPQCELVVWLQQLEPTSLGSPYSSALLSFIERELRFPTGSIVPPAPEMRFEMTAFSPDCGYILTSQGPPDFSPRLANHLVGPKAQVLTGQGRHHLLIYMVALGLQLGLIKKQMGESSTPSTRSRISFHTILGMAMGDGFTTLACATLGVVTDGLAMDLMALAFMSFTGMLFFGMQFLLQIWSVQAPELRQRERVEVEEQLRRRETALAEIREARERRQAAAAELAAADAAANPPANPEPEQTNGTSVASPNTQEGTLPLPATAPRPSAAADAPLFYMPSDQAGLQQVQPLQPLTEEQHNALVEAITNSRVPTFGYHYARFFLMLFGTVFISINALGWPSAFQRGFFTLLAFLYLSFWIPQITRNVQRNCRRALEWDFVLGQSALRLLPFAYFYAYPHNVLFAGVDYYSLATLIIWQWLQVVILASQDLLGPRWFVRESWVPSAYDYHPVLRYDEEGATLPLGASSTTESQPTSRRASVSGTDASGRRNSLAQHKDAKGKGKRTFDCAICMQDLEVPVVEAGETAGDVAGGFVLARRLYMVTPCRHIFHTPCLEGWMKYRLQCPNCREGLPPL
ncbi:hypothetical protein Q7P36_001808 [Cladosporium allicinum]